MDWCQFNKMMLLMNEVDFEECMDFKGLVFSNRKIIDREDWETHSQLVNNLISVFLNHLSSYNSRK